MSFLDLEVAIGRFYLVQTIPIWRLDQKIAVQTIDFLGVRAIRAKSRVVAVKESRNLTFKA